MRFKTIIKTVVEKAPYPIGRAVSLVPFSLRLGSVYGREKDACAYYENADKESQVRYAVEHFRAAFNRAKQFGCYRALYEKAGVLDLEIRCTADIAKVPTIDKNWTRAHIGEFKGAYKLNTGGSSGMPTPFWMDGECWAREWAHMHTIWEKLGYRYTDLKLAIRGKNLGKRPFVYNPVHNEYVVNTYLDVKDYASRLQRLFSRREIRWFHGYPSSIYQFIIECENAFGEEKTADMFKSVRGLLLSSEYPHANIVEKFDHYGLRWISWYGHSEMAVLAWGDRGDQTIVYHPFVTYGLSEVVDGHLVGTSFHNFDMPLIRYDTGDLVDGVGDSPVNPAFRIKEGRNGDFIEDRHGKKIPLTALIFGRHHKAFDVADYIQIGQNETGKATLYVTFKSADIGERSIERLFDLTNVDIDFDLKILPAPIRTGMGKLKLRV